MASKGKKSGIEWVGGLVGMPAHVKAEGETYQPEMLVWIAPEDGAVLGIASGRPGEVIAMVGDSLSDTAARPMIGRPHQPTRVRVASAELAGAVRFARPGLEVVVAPTPEVDEFLVAAGEAMKPDGDDDLSYLEGGMRPDEMAAFFRAAAGLCRGNPWKVIPGGTCLSVSIEALDLHEGALSIIGQLGESFGVILFASLDDFDAFSEAAAASERGEEAEVPAYTSLDFVGGAELGRLQRKEIAEHGWEVAEASAYPGIAAIDEGLERRPPGRRDHARLEAVALALPRLLAEPEAVAAAIGQGITMSRRYTVATIAGEVEVSLRLPHEDQPTRRLSAAELCEAFRALDRGGELELDDLAPLEGELLYRFELSPEGKGLGELRWTDLVMDLARGHIGCTVVTLGATELEELVFDIIPRKVMVGEEAAPEIIAELRALFTYLGRELGVDEAEACLAVLGGDAEADLRHALADDGSFDGAKAMLARGLAAGFDMSSEAGIQAFMRTQQAAPGPRVGKAKNKAKAKKKRASASKARKKNR
jgi:hypothetical protein